MKTVITFKNSFKNTKGFTLVEIAIVLVIIGIILGAAMKGKDLIYGARYKKFINAGGHAWTSTAFNYMDRMGHFPGDTDDAAAGGKPNGIIADGASEDVLADITAAKFVETPANPLILGSFTFYFFMGNDGATPAKNLLLVCMDSTCATKFDAESLKFIQAFDTSIDGTADGTAGLVRCLNTSPTSEDFTKYIAVSGAATVSAACTAGATYAMAYYFDRGP